MATYSLIMPMVALLVTGLLLVRAEHARRRAELRIGRLEREVAQRTRHLDLCARELHAQGMTLMGQGTGPLSAEGLEEKGRAMLCLAADIHDLAASQADPRRIQPEPTPLGPLLREVVEKLSLALAPGRRQWRIAPDLAGLTVIVDRRALHGALAQVLARAVRHTREGDPIALRLMLAEATLSVVVEDEGAGLAAGDLGPSMAEGGGTRGLALGLVVARQLLQAHGGELRVEAVQGIGARTWLTLPSQCLIPTSGAPQPALETLPRLRAAAPSLLASAGLSPVAGVPAPGG